LRDIVERESAIRIFERATGYARTFGAIVAVVGVLLAALGIYKWADLSSAIQAAKQNVSQTADGARQSIAQTSLNTTQAGQAVIQEARSAQLQVAKQSGQLKTEIEGVQRQLESAGKIQGQMGMMRDELARQQKVLSSSEEFARSVFSSHRVDYFRQDQTPADRYRVLTRRTGAGATVYLLLSRAPIKETLQLQYHIYAQPINSYGSIHNLVIFSWGDTAPPNLKDFQISASYFPDASDNEVIKGLSEADGRVYADGEPLIRASEPDPGFTGNKWMKLAAQQ